MGKDSQKTVQISSPEKTQTLEQFTGSREGQWTSPRSKVPFQADTIQLMHSTGAIVSIPHLHGVKICLQKSRLIKPGDWILSAMISSYRL